MRFKMFARKKKCSQISRTEIITQHMNLKNTTVTVDLTSRRIKATIYSVMMVEAGVGGWLMVGGGGRENRGY